MSVLEGARGHPVRSFHFFVFASTTPTDDRNCKTCVDESTEEPGIGESGCDLTMRPSASVRPFVEKYSRSSALRFGFSIIVP